MKKLLFLSIVALFATGCNLTKLTNSSTKKQPVAAVFADLNVSPTKVTHFYIPPKTVVVGGYDNVLNSAIRDALLNNGDADVFVGLETQVKYNSKGEIESITVSGYPAKYENFRNPGDEYLSKMPGEDDSNKSNGKGVFGIKLGKK